MVLAQPATGELLALKRVKLSVGGVSRMTLLFPATDETGAPISDVQAHLLPDCYLGLDQMMSISVEVKSDRKASYVKAVESLDASSKQASSKQASSKQARGQGGHRVNGGHGQDGSCAPQVV